MITVLILVILVLYLRGIGSKPNFAEPRINYRQNLSAAHEKQRFLFLCVSLMDVGKVLVSRVEETELKTKLSTHPDSYVLHENEQEQRNFQKLEAFSCF